MVFDSTRRIKYILLLSLILAGCVTVDTFNSRINTPRKVEDLKKDVEYAEHKLEKLHPDLYHFITKKDLEYKFDSLKASITGPMTPNDFYFKLSPVIASIRQGHTQTFPLTRKLKPAEKKIEKTKGLTPLAQYDYELFDNRLFIVRNNSDDPCIQAGTEVLRVNGIKPAEIISNYRNTFTSDGYNTTFITRKLGRAFARYFYYRYGLQDSVSCELNYKDTVRTILLRRFDKTKKPELKKTKEEKDKDRKLQLAESKKRRLLGYDPLRRMYSKQLTFPVKDSSVAIMKISDFMKGNYKKFYKQSFHLLDSLHTKTLILDVRDNGGGHVHEINTLYSYLADSSFHLVEKSEVTSRTSLWHFGYYHDTPVLVKAIQTVLLPFVAVGDLYTFLKVRKDKDQKYYYSFKDSKLTKPQKTRFKGKVYVLINGGCFSATCLISSNLKGSNRATFVGEETGGSYNGCVAGILPVSTLPASKLGVRYGLMNIKAPYTSEKDGRGIFPDVEIIPTIEDRVKGNDPELDWVLTQISTDKYR
ncbi:MAG: S41 family peptidase [Paludibacter sp.]|nr:S41 family peptidase [Paludibacter sp.]